MEKENLELIQILLNYGFAVTAQDDGYYRFKYIVREEEVLSDDSVHIFEEKIKVELDFTEKKFRINGTLTNDKDTFFNGDRSFNFIPSTEELIRLLEDQYDLKVKKQ